MDFAALPDCRYHPRPDNSVISMDELQFAASQGECEALCDQARGFTCRAFTYAADEKRCYLSGDDSIALNNAPLMSKRGALYAEKQCSISKTLHISISLFVFVLALDAFGAFTYKYIFLVVVDNTPADGFHTPPARDYFS